MLHVHTLRKQNGPEDILLSTCSTTKTRYPVVVYIGEYILTYSIEKKYNWLIRQFQKNLIWYTMYVYTCMFVKKKNIFRSYNSIGIHNTHTHTHTSLMNEKAISRHFWYWPIRLPSFCKSIMLSTQLRMNLLNHLTCT